MKEPRISTTDAKRMLADIVDGAMMGKRAVLTRRDKDQAALVSLDDLERLRAMDEEEGRDDV